MHFCILGPLEVQTDKGVFRSRGSHHNRLLLTLLINAGQLVTTDDLINEVWPEDRPDRVENALQAHISRLRRKLAALEPQSAEPRLVTHASGYQLLARPGEIDSEIFVRNLEHIRERVELCADAAAAAQELRECLAMWRGPALGGIAAGPICEAATARFEELYVSAFDLLFNIELENGNYPRIVPELRQLVAQYPDHERFWQQLITALYRSERKTEALAAYRQLRNRLAEELGLEPTPAMREYERAILQGDLPSHRSGTYDAPPEPRGALADATAGRGWYPPQGR